MEPKYKRVLLKVSGEALGGSKGSGYDFDVIDEVARNIKKCLDAGVEVAIVTGGGNLWRGRSSGAMDRVTADQMGMMATVMNSLCIKDALNRAGAKAVVMSMVDMPKVSETFTAEKARKYLDDGYAVIFSGGTGSPFFSTDTAAALKAAEIEADVMLMAKKVDAVYTSDPEKDPEAKKIEAMTYSQMLEQKLGAIDLTAASFLMQCKITTLIFALGSGENILHAAMGENMGTIVKEEK